MGGDNAQIALKELLSLASGNARRNRNNQETKRRRRVILFNIGFRPVRGLREAAVSIRRALPYAVDLEGFQPSNPVAAGEGVALKERRL